MLIADVQRLVTSIRENVARVMVGKDAVVDLLLVALLCEGHVLLEDVPGIGKTTLARTLARSLGCSFQRIQFTPDLLPSDITGVSVYSQKSAEFEYRPGPVVTQILLADEINRAGPRTQAALLEAMEERQVTVDGVSHALPRPFLVLATQNPIELEGTFPLPEAQIDRFLMRLAIGYPSRSEEIEIFHRFGAHNPLATLQPVVSGDDMLAAGAACRAVFVHPVLENYLMDLVEASRRHGAITLGASPRASLALHRASQALAATQGRDFVTPQDIKRLAAPVLAHRLILAVDARMRGRSSRDVLNELVEQVAVPVEETWSEGAATA